MQNKMITYEDFLRESVLGKEEIDLFLDPKEPTWAKFDPELGFVPGNYTPRDGLDGALTISTTLPNGARTSVIYADRPCRINTYGDSFTHCNQVSDHESWQEYLAAHLGEPLRNFGVGSYGVYQAYRRMVRMEEGDDGSEYVILYIWGDDHYRSLVRCRHVQIHRWFNRFSGRMLHGNFWDNLEIDLETGELVEKGNLLPTPESVYRMTDPDFLVEALRDDWMLQMTAYVTGNTCDVDKHSLSRLAEVLGCEPPTADDEKEMRDQVARLRDAYAFAATRHVIDRTVEFIEKRGKKLMILLFCPQATRQLILNQERYDEPVVQHLRARKIRYFDMNLVHVEDYKCFNLPVAEYMKRYLIGHYSPAGNHFFAFAVKDAIVDWLDPKPPTYRPEGQEQIDFRDYLPE